MTALLAGGYFLVYPVPVQILNLRTTDLVMQMVGRPAEQLPVVVIEIDEQSIRHYGQWPWPRNRLAELLSRLNEAGAVTIGVNILFPERDRTSPGRLLEVLEEDFGISLPPADLSEGILDYDRYLADVLRQGPYVMGYEFFFDTDKSAPSACDLEPLSILYEHDEASAAAFMALHEADDVLCNHKILAESAARAGFLNGISDADGVVRRLPLLIAYEGAVYPSFALAMLMHHLKTDLVRLKAENDWVNHIILDDYSIPIDDHGYLHLGADRVSSFPRIGARDVLEGTFDPAAVAGKVVIVGLAAAGLTQTYTTPIHETTTLLDLHALSIHSLASGSHTIRVPFFRLIETVVAILGCFLLAAAVAWWPAVLSGASCLVLIVLSWTAAGLIYRLSGFLFSPFFVTSALLITGIVLLALKYRYLQALAQEETESALLQLQASERELSSILGTIPDIVFRLDRQGRITFVSQAIARYGTTAAPLIGRSIFEFVKTEDVVKADRKLNERRTGERATYDLELRLRFPSKHTGTEGDTRFFSVSAAGIYDSSEPGGARFIGTQGIVRDITDRKVLEQELVQAQKMEVIGNLAAGIAHDLNNILAGLVGYPDLLLMEIPEDSPLYHKILLLKKSGQKAAVIVQDLLTLARRKIPISSTCSLNSIIREYLDSVEFDRLHAKYPDIAITTELDENIGTIKGSEVHLSKVIMNVVHNSMEAMAAGGTITIRTFRVSLSEPLKGYEFVPRGIYVCITIIDTGVGIASDDLKKIFEPFYTKRTEKGEGTGLGMTVVWVTVKDHWGYVDIKSSPGKGTALQLYFPASDAAPAAKSLRQSAASGGGESILVVDDMADQLEMARSMLEKLGYEVNTAEGGGKALELLAKRSYDLVVLDMIMPGMSGLETFRKMRKLQPHQKAIIASGYSASDEVAAVSRLGAGRLVQKPYTMEEIGRAIREELDREPGPEG